MLTIDRSLENSGYRYLPQVDDLNKLPSPNQSLLPLTAQVNQDHCLEIGGCDIKLLVKRFGSPLYILDEFTLRSACRQYRDSFATYYSG